MLPLPGPRRRVRGAAWTALAGAYTSARAQKTNNKRFLMCFTFNSQGRLCFGGRACATDRPMSRTKAARSCFSTYSTVRPLSAAMRSCSSERSDTTTCRPDVTRLQP